MTSDVRVELHDEVGNYLRTITDIISLDCAVAYNTVGVLTLTIPDDHDIRFYRRDYQLRVFLDSYSHPPQQFADDTFFLNKLRRRDGLLTLSGPDAMDALNRALIGYTSETLYADKTAEEADISGAYWQYFYIDDLMRAFVRENIGPEALDDTRINPFVTIEGDRSLAPTGQKAASYANLLATLQDLARQSEDKGTSLFFSLWPDGQSNYIFRVWSNQARVDRSSTSISPLVLLEERGDLEDVEETYSWEDEGNVVYGLGGGSGSSRVVVVRKNEGSLRGGPFSRREFTHEMQDVDHLDEGNQAWVDGELGAALQGKRPRVNISASVSEGGQMIYGRDFAFGDRIMIVTGLDFYRQTDCHVSAARLTMDNGKVKTAIGLTGVEFLNG